MFKHKLLAPKDCPVCEKIIYIFNERSKPVKLNDEGMLFWVKFNDDTNAQFAICKDCFLTLKQEQLDKLMQDQIYTWGIEIINTPMGIADLGAQLKWYVNTAVHLKIVKHGRDKDAIQT